MAIGQTFAVGMLVQWSHFCLCLHCSSHASYRNPEYKIQQGKRVVTTLLHPSKIQDQTLIETDG